MLNVQDITVTYSQNPRPTIEGFHLQMKPGEICSIVGESGSGKTTVIRSILGVLPGGGKVTKGDILFEGESLLHYSKKQWRDLRGTQISMIFQNAGAMINPVRKIGSQYVEYIRAHRDISKKDAADMAIQMLEKMRLPNGKRIMDSYSFELSGGMCQRVGIARALAVNPEFIVCDEPISALDVSIQAQVINMFEELQEKLGVAYLFIAHDLLVVHHISDRIAVMYLGRIVEIADSNELNDNPMHPYTQSLLSAVPYPDPKMAKERQRIVLEGDVPSPLHMPSGCAFRTRCRYATEKCAQECPSLTDRGNGHQVACWNK